MPRPDLPPADTITAKGSTLKAALAFVDSRWGEEGHQRLMDALDAETRAWVCGLILSATRYPLERFVRVYEAIDRVFARGDLALCWDLGRFSGEYEVKLAHKVFLKIARLEYWFKMAGATWRSYYSRGTLTPEIGEREGRLTLSEFNPISKAFCYRFGGWVETVVRMANLEEVRMTHPECVLDGDPACIFHGTWRRR